MHASLFKSSMLAGSKQLDVSIECHDNASSMLAPCPASQPFLCSSDAFERTILAELQKDFLPQPNPCR